MAWNKLKSMFIVTEPARPSPNKVDSPEADSADALIAKYQVGPQETYALPPVALPPEMAVASGAAAIDFQGLYDQAGIPNTDEVEAVERFLAGLDTTLPDTAKLAAAKAFLGAIGKAPQDVINDAGRKIAVVRAVADTKRADAENASMERQAVIAELERKIADEKDALLALQKDLESVRSQCAIEESRLQGARMFFGYVGELSGGVTR